MEITESGIKFSFADNAVAVKYDDTAFYRDRYAPVEGGKGVDILAAFPNAVYIIEVKNCCGTAENQDSWRRHYGGPRNMDTFTTEIAQKTAHTLACLAGVSSFGNHIQAEEALLAIARALQSEAYANCTKKLLVLLYLEGDFSCESRSNIMIFRDLRQRLERKLKWLNCSVDIVNTHSHRAKDFSVSLVPR